MKWLKNLLSHLHGELLFLPSILKVSLIAIMVGIFLTTLPLRFWLEDYFQGTYEVEFLMIFGFFLMNTLVMIRVELSDGRFTDYGWKERLLVLSSCLILVLMAYSQKWLMVVFLPVFIGSTLWSFYDRYRKINSRPLSKEEASILEYAWGLKYDPDLGERDAEVPKWLEYLLEFFSTLLISLRYLFGTKIMYL